MYTSSSPITCKIILTTSYADVKSIEKGLIICKKSLAQVQSAPALPEEKEKKEEKEEDVSDQTLIATDPRKRTFVSVAGIVFSLFLGETRKEKDGDRGMELLSMFNF